MGTFQNRVGVPRAGLAFGYGFGQRGDGGARGARRDGRAFSERGLSKLTKYIRGVSAATAQMRAFLASGLQAASSQRLANLACKLLALPVSSVSVSYAQ